MMVVNNERGQSILEIVFMLPFLFIFVALLYKINMASQMSINNTQFARSQMFVLTANSPEYPRLGFRFKAYGGTGIPDEGHARLVLGVADPEALVQASGTGDLPPIPQVQKIARSGTTAPGSTAVGEVTRRTDIRVRNTVSICTQFNSAGGGGNTSRMDWLPTTVERMGARRWPFGQNTVCFYESQNDGVSI